MFDNTFSSRTYIMGILNLTPDSFSGDGIYKNIDLAIEQAERMVQEGADIIDIGGESTRPGSESVPLDEEIERVIPVIKKLAKRIDKPISIDTSKSEVARFAMENGASIVNDISGLEFDEMMCNIVSRYDAKVVLMHIKGNPRTMQLDPTYDDVVNEVIERLGSLVKKAETSGIKKENIILDPGIGFGKTYEHNLEILNSLSRFKSLEKPILVGTSRKSFIGNILGVEEKNRMFGTAASVALAIKNGANIIRVHDVKEMSQVAKVSDAIIRSGEKINVS
ncbi:MAG: dihydropteroate synthase [Candidatus Omnitrophota bacterium]